MPAQTEPEALEATSFGLRTAEGDREIGVHWGPDAHAGRRRAFLATRDGEREVVSPIYEVWRVDSGALDGAGVDLIVLGEWSDRDARDEPAPRRVVRVVALERDEHGRLGFADRWRGSAMARPLLDFRVEAAPDGLGVATLVTQELGEGGAGCERARYAWNGFGFRGEGRDEISCDAGL